MTPDVVADLAPQFVAAGFGLGVVSACAFVAGWKLTDLVVDAYVRFRESRVKAAS